MRSLYFFLFLCFSLEGYGSKIVDKSYTLSICSVKNLENSFTCIDRSLQECKKVFVIEDRNLNIYRVNCGVFSTYKDVKKFEKRFVTEAIKHNKPFIKSYNFNIAKYENFLATNDAIDITDELSILNNQSKEKYIDTLTDSLIK